LTIPGLEPTIYRTRGDYANNNTTDAVKKRTEEKKISFTYIFINKISSIFIWFNTHASHSFIAN
jgi:hypothetical protein